MHNEEIELSIIDITNDPHSHEASDQTASGHGGPDILDGNSRFQKLKDLLFQHTRLDRQLERQQITGIALSGCVGAGLFITSGEFIAISGSIGIVLSFICAGIIIISVMRCLAEMVSVRPLAGALMDFVDTFVDEALGFAVGATYWLANCLSMATLTSFAARVVNNFRPLHPLTRWAKFGIIIALLALTLLSNLCGVRLYGNLERGVKWIKLSILLSLCVLMILVNVGVGGRDMSVSRWQNITENALPPAFSPSGYNTTSFPVPPGSDMGISGATGRFVALWTSITLAFFPCMGGDIVIVAAGEAMHPRRDVAPAARFMYLVPLGFYIVASFLVGLCINYSHPGLNHPWLTSYPLNFESTSPFVLVLKDSSIAPNALTTVFSALFLFSAYTAGNTALYAASRTLFVFVQRYGGDGRSFLQRTIGRTNDGGTPIAAILVSSSFGLLAFSGLADTTFNQPTHSMSSFFTGSTACVYMAECIAYLRFRRGLSRHRRNFQFNRSDPDWSKKFYKPHWQLTLAWVGLIGCALVVFFSGWPAIYILSQRHRLVTGNRLKPNDLLAWDLVGAYAGPCFFVTLYVLYKMTRRTRFRTYDSVRGKYLGTDTAEFDNNKGIQRRARRRGWRYCVPEIFTYWIPEIFSFVK